MKSFMLAALAALAVFQQAESRLLPSDAPDNTTLDINSMFDSVVEKLNARLKDSGLDPLPLPDKTFSLGGLLFGSLLEVGLKKGHLTNLMSMKRGGDASLESNDKTQTVKADINFGGLEISYNFVAKILLIPLTVPVGATVTDSGAHVELEVDLSKKKLKLKSLNLRSLSKISVHIGWLGVHDWAISTVTDVVDKFFHKEVMVLSEKLVRVEAEKVVESFDLTGLIG